MYRFWTYITKPILEILNPRVIVEIGSADGRNTRNLLEFCQQTKGVLHSIDPVPDFPVANWQSEFGNLFVFHRQLSLSILPSIQSIDVVLIDGDHNWYTVYNELKEIKETCDRENYPFPFIMFHDVGWPYARRDLYYDPETIPAEYRKPYSRKGILPNVAGLADEGGLNSNLYNAVSEFLPQSGVLTAIEDFQKETKDLDFIQIPAFHGFGLLYERSLREKNSKLNEFLENLPSYLVTNGFLADVEANRVNLAILRANANEKLAKTQDKLAKTQDKLAQAQDKIKQRDADIQQLLSWLKNSETAFHALLNSNRWKLGNRIGELWLRLRGKPKEPLITDDLFDLFNHLHEWEQKGVPAIQKSARNFTHITAEIVICVHNALVDVKVCLDSIRNNTASRHRVIIVDDGSNDECRDYLSNYSSQHENVTIIRNESARGYTIAANQGLQKSRAEFVVLLNSDTIVTPNWLENLLECAESSQQIGIVGPLSNAASWQSIPELFDLAKDWSINPLPSGWNPNQMAELVTSYSHKEFPRVPLLNGFCLAMKRSVIEKIGYLDEQSFPEGYGEENDYCIRAVDAGFELAVADHVYIYHSKSKSYTHDRRLALSKRSQSALTSKHGSERIDRDVTVLRQQPVLQKMRNRVNQAIKNQKSQRSNLVVSNQETKPFSVMFLVLLQKIRNRVNQAIKNRRSQNSNSLLSNQETKPFSVMFVLPVSGWGGGIHSIFQETAAMRTMGANARIAVPRSELPAYKSNYPNLENIADILLGFSSKDELVDYSSEFHVVVGTIYHSMKLVNKIASTNTKILPAYYIQDYEPRFFAKDSKQWKEAYQSYTLIKNAILFAKTNWLCEVVGTEHHVRVEKVLPSLDHSIYYPLISTTKRAKWPVRISAMIRPASPRRAAQRTLRALKRLKQKYDQRVEVHLFGCEHQDYLIYHLENDFEHIDHGELIRENVANLLRQSDIFVDFSDYQAFGRTGIEAMACGCAVVLPQEGGVHDFAIHGENSLIINSKNEDDCYIAMEMLVEQADMRKRLQQNAIQKAEEFSPLRAARSELSLLKDKYAEFLSTTNKSNESKSPDSQSSQELCVTGVLSPTAKGYVGSAYIRLIQPLTHPSLKGKLTFTPRALADVYTDHPDVVVVQRIAIPDENEAHKLVNFCNSNNVKLIYEIDDDLFEIGSSGSSHPEAEKYAKWIRGAKILALNADLVTVSSNNLKSKLTNLNENIKVLPNALDEQVWQVGSLSFPANNSSDDQVGILYMGTKTHNQDLEIIREALSEIKKKYQGKVRFDIVGVSSDKLDSKLFNVINTPADTSEYPEFASWMLKHASAWAIGLAPLAQTSFNECKSYVKFLDYSAVGLASICSNITAYQDVITNGHNGILADNNTQAWYDALVCLLDDINLRETIRKNAYETLLDRHILRSRAADWLHVYQAITSSDRNF